MSHVSRGLLVSAAVAALAFGAGAAFAAGGGGMGGGMGGGDVPEASGPRYDPVQEYQRGMEAMQANRYRDAARHFQRVADAAPSDANSWYLLGQAKAGVPDLRGARRAYERAIRNDRNMVAAHRELALTAARMNEPAQANTELQWLRTRQAECANTCPQAAELTASVSAVEAVLAPPAAAAPAAAAPGSGAAAPSRLIFASAAQGNVSYSRAVALINERRWSDALGALDEAQAAFGPHPDVLTYRGYVWRHMGDAARAESFYRQALAIDPNHVGAMEYYGELKVQQGDLAGARQLLARLDRVCAFGCAEADTLRRWIERGGDPSL